MLVVINLLLAIFLRFRTGDKDIKRERVRDLPIPEHPEHLGI